MLLSAYLKTHQEIEAIRRSALLVSEVLARVAEAIRPGIPTAQLDQLAEETILSYGAKPAFKGYNGFPATLCISVNEAVVHGIPGKYEIREGDIVSVDCGVVWEGWYGDAAYTFIVQGAENKKMELCRTTLESLEKCINFAGPGKTIGDVGHFIQKYVESRGYSVVRELVGHGLGRQLHEPPEVPNFGQPGKGPVLREGLVIAIEPMVNQGKRFVKTLSDNWTVVTADGLPSAHYEHTVAITEKGLTPLSSFSPVEKAICQNPYLLPVYG
ncbi:MAG: type I methionyl aminopeptidase [Flavobacteriales bacterium]|nr:type I methionyl aminopeptidase [Flavobacteriales bacterium]MCX7768024.1 type I methionyl aminopeptidase [Flavobacteriales bacterium]MDW8409229.1 type I methionyl aminopeptidase [Flavobacteriales bacterium]